MTPFQIGILLFLGLFLTMIYFISKKIFIFTGKIESIIKSYGDVNKSTLSIQELVISITKSADDRIKDLESKLDKALNESISADKKAKEAIEIKENYVKIIKEDKVLYRDFALVWTEPKENFKVDYECDVLDVSESMAKVRPYAISSDNKRFNNLSEDEKTNPTEGTFRHVYEKWVPLNKLELIIDLGRS